MKILRSLVLSVGLISGGAVIAADFPQRPIQFIVPLAPGGTTDIVARILGTKMAEFLDTAVVIENRPGAGGTIASNYVAKADPDGYTILMGTIGTMAIAPAMYESLPYDPDTAFEPVSLVNTGQFVIVSHPDTGIDSLDTLLSKAKANPGVINYGSAGNGSTLHLGMELLKQEANVDLVHVPYRGSGPLVTAIIAGEVDVGMPDIPSALGFIQTGRLVPLAVTGPERAGSQSTIPTVAESGFEGFDVSVWLGIVAPKGTPAPIIERLNEAVRYAVDDADFQKKLSELDSHPRSSSPEEFAMFIQNERTKWQATVDASGARIN